MLVLQNVLKPYSLHKNLILPLMLVMAPKRSRSLTDSISVSPTAKYYNFLFVFSSTVFASLYRIQTYNHLFTLGLAPNNEFVAKAGRLDGLE